MAVFFLKTKTKLCNFQDEGVDLVEVLPAQESSIAESIHYFYLFFYLFLAVLFTELNEHSIKLCVQFSIKCSTDLKMKIYYTKTKYIIIQRYKILLLEDLQRT